ncbi:MAG: hypothetical protein JWM27_3106 [Gemmatimonadetes bacterium]|nr:hypothetical protein [Gemmatimonadota bacterium]
MTGAALRRATCAVVALLGATLAAFPGHAQGPAPFALAAWARKTPAAEPAVFSVRVGERPAQALPALVDAQRRLLLPVVKIAEAAGVSFAAGGGGGHAFRPESATGGIAADTALHQLRNDSTTLQLGPDELVVSEGEVYAPATLLAALLDAELAVEWGQLTARITRARPFPAEARLAVAERRAGLAPVALSETDANPRAVPFLPKSGGLVLDWELSAQSLNPTRSTSFSPTLGTAAWGGELKVAATLSSDERGDAAPVDVHAQYRRAFPTGRLVRQVEVGDVSAEGPFLQQLQGVRITNVPHTQESVFGMVPIRPSVPEGWEYEIYQEGRLVGFSDAIADGSPPALIRYGSSDVQVREIGPDGQERVRDLTFAVPYSMVRQGTFRYDLGAGRCQWADCSAGAFASGRYGLTNALTVGGGFNLRRGGAGGDAFKPYLGLAFANAHGASGELQVERGAAGSASVQLLGSSRLGLQASARLDPSYRLGAESLSVGVPRRYWTGDASATYRTSAAGISAVRLSGHVDGHLGDGLERWNAGGAVYHAGGAVEASLTAGPAVPAYLGVHGTQTLGRLFGTMPSSLSAGASLGGKGFQTADAGLSVGALGWANVSAAVRWDRTRSARPAVELGFSAFTRSLRVHSRISTEHGAARNHTTISARGSLADAGFAGVSALPGPAEGSGGITGVVYFDHDADGRFTPGDSVLAGQVIQVGGVPVRTDARGRFVRWNISPYDVAYVRIHPNAVTDPALTPSQPEHRVRPVPNRAITVDFPVVQTRPVGGQVEGMPDGALGGITLNLADEHGQMTATTTFADGAWYVARVRPGRYRLSVAPSSLAALSARAEHVELVVPADGDADVQAPTIHISTGDVRVAVDTAAALHERPASTYSDTGGKHAQPETSGVLASRGGSRDGVHVGGSSHRGGRRAHRGATGPLRVAALQQGVLDRAGARVHGVVVHRPSVLPQRGEGPGGASQLRRCDGRRCGGTPQRIAAPIPAPASRRQVTAPSSARAWWRMALPKMPMVALRDGTGWTGRG